MDLGSPGPLLKAWVRFFDNFCLIMAPIKIVSASKIRCLSLYATHYHEMATLESKVDNAFNMHTSVFVDDNKVTHLFQVEEGPSSTSYGIEIAQLAGFPEKILKRARDQNETEQWTENICAKVFTNPFPQILTQNIR